MAVSIIGPKFYAWDRNGKPLAFGKIFTYQARTNTPKPTYQSEDQKVENTNPVILNGEGYANIYLSGSYKIVLKDDKDNEIWTADPVSEAADGNGLSYVLTAYYLTSSSFKVLGNHTVAMAEGARVEIGFVSSSEKQSTVLSSSYDGQFTECLIEDAIIRTDIITASLPTGFSSIADFEQISKEQLEAQEKAFQDRFAFSQPELPWLPNSEIEDDLQIYTTGVVGESGYMTWLADPLLIPFTTSATFAEDIALGRWTSATVATRDWVSEEALDISSKESSLGDDQSNGLSTYPKSSQSSASDGEDIGSNITALRLIGGDFPEVTKFKCVRQDGDSDGVSGVLTNINLTSRPYSAKVGGVDVYLGDVKYNVGDAEFYWSSPDNSPSINVLCAKAAISSGKRVIYNHGDHEITSLVDQITATENQTAFVISHNQGGSLTTISRNLVTLWQYSNAGGQESGEYTFSDLNNFTIQTPATAGQVFIVATTELAFQNGVDMKNGSRLVLKTFGATCPRFDGPLGSGVVNCVSGDGWQTGPLVLGDQSPYEAVIATNFMTTGVSLGRPNVNGAYNLQIGKLAVFNEAATPGNLGVEFGGGWPQSNSNNIEQLLVKGAHKRKWRCSGQNNKAENCDVLTSSLNTDVYAIIKGQGNKFLNVYDEIGTGGASPDTIVEFGSSDESPGSYSCGNIFEIGLLATSKAAGNRIKDWTGANTFKGSPRIGGNFAGCFSPERSRNLFENPEFLSVSGEEPFCVTSNRPASFSVVDTDSLGYFAGEGVFPSLGRKSMKIVQDGTTINGPVFYYAQDADVGPSNTPNNGKSFFPVEYFRGKLVSIGMWVFVIGSQSALDAATISLTPSFGAGNERVTEVYKWTFITASSFMGSDVVPPSTLSASLSVVNFSGNVYCSNVQIYVGELPNLQGQEAALLTKGGNILGDLYSPKGVGVIQEDTTNGNKYRIEVINGVITATII